MKVPNAQASCSLQCLTNVLFDTLAQCEASLSSRLLPCLSLLLYKWKNHSLNEYGCRDAQCKKSWKQGYPLSNTIKDTSTIMRNPLPELCREGLRMIVLVSLIVLLRGYPCFHDFCIVHPYIHIHSMNDFSTCSTYFSRFAYI